MDVGKKRLGSVLVREASATATAYMILVVIGCFALLGAEGDITLPQALVEVVSAIATVGLTTGITPHALRLFQDNIDLSVFGGGSAS